MKSETKEIYKCEYCKKHYLLKHAAIYHEALCFNNPENKRPCYQCQYLEKKEVEIYSGFDDCMSSEPINIKRHFFFCTAKQQFLYTPQNEVKGNYNHVDTEGGVFENYPMPKECEVYVNALEDFFNII